MKIEEEIFKRSYVNRKKLEKYGFQRKENIYLYSKTFLDDSFRADITIDETGKVSGRIWDLFSQEEYTNIRVENEEGSFVNTVREEYKRILKDIKDNCFETKFYISDQANRITEFIKKKYHDEPEFLWESAPGYGVFRNKENEKWYGIIMNVDKSKLKDGSGEVEIIDLKCEEETIRQLIKEPGYYEGYHMNKKNWITILLDDTIPDEEIIKFIDKSYELVQSPEEWIVPANPKYYDIINCFNNTDTIEWKQSTDIHIGDIVYLYVAEPYSCILYKCQAIDIKIPFEYQDKNLSIKYLMKIKLIKRYKEKEITFQRLNELGIKAIRGPRKISKEISKLLDNNR